MSRKFTIEFVKREFEKEGYTLLSTNYKNNKQKLEYICPKGHKGTIVWGSWQQGRRCAECGSSKKKDIEFIRQEFEKGEYQLLTTIYKNSKQKLEYICPKGHRGTISWNGWNSGQRCAECAGLKKKNIEFIRKEFKKEGYRLLTNKYKNSFQKLEYICPKKHRSSISWGSWKRGHRCAECASNKKRSIKFVKEFFEKGGYQLLTKKYKNSSQKLEYICPKGHKGKVSWNSWQQGVRCAKCHFINASNSNSYNWKNYSKEEINQFNTYKANVTQLTRQNYIKYYYYVNPNKLPRGRNLYHLDHIFSVRDGFDIRVSPEIVASPSNLQMLSEKENISKSSRSDMSKEILYELYYQFEEEIKETKI